MDIDFYNVEELRKAHDYHFEQFLNSKDFKHFEAAKAIAAKIIEYENKVKAFRFSNNLRNMYFRNWNF